MNLPGIVARTSLPFAAGIAYFLAKRFPSYRPVAETLFLAASFDILRGNVSGTFLSPPLLLAFPCLSASLALKVLAKLPRWPCIAVWGVLAGLTLVPVSRAFLEPLGRFYGGVHVAGLLVQVFGIWKWSTSDRHQGDRVYGQFDRVSPTIDDVKITRKFVPHAGKYSLSDRSDNLAPFAALILFAGDLAALFGPFAAGDPTRDWYVAQAQTILLFLVFNVWQLAQFRRTHA